MSTRSRIGYVEKDGSVVSIYSHWDGYPGNAGQILTEVVCAIVKKYGRKK